MRIAVYIAYTSIEKYRENLPTKLPTKLRKASKIGASVAYFNGYDSRYQLIRLSLENTRFVGVFGAIFIHKMYYSEMPYLCGIENFYIIFTHEFAHGLYCYMCLFYWLPMHCWLIVVHVNG